VSEGAAEWSVRGLFPGACRAGLEDHGELFHIYDYTYADSDNNYNPGTIARKPAGGNPGGSIRTTGSGDSNNQDTCTREGGILTRVVSTAGLHSVRVEYDVITSLRNPPSASAEGNCPVLEGSSEDQLVVYYSTSGTAGPWALAQQIREAELPAAWRSEVIDLASVPAVDDNSRFALRFQWQFNAREEEGRIDNVRVEGAVIRSETRFDRADANADGRGDISDAVFVLFYLFRGDSSLECEKSADANDSGRVDVSDPVHFLNHLFLNGPQPSPPFGECGIDPTPDALACESHAACG
jgi:hypothetical protein